MNEALKSAVYGFAVGDALGVPFEFWKRGTFKCNDMVGYGTWNQSPGTWSDDTSMVLATCASIKNMGRIDPDDIMYNFLHWKKYGKYTAHGEVFDIGNTTALAINCYDEGTPWNCCGLSNERSLGNGSLMRILPLAFVDGMTFDDVKNVSCLTHAHPICAMCCDDYINHCMNFLAGDYYISALVHGVDKKESEIVSSGYVLRSLNVALWCVANTESYKSCVLKAVNLGGDTDTIAAIAGGLAGIKYGDNAIPKEWIEKLANKELIDSCLF